MTAGVEAIQRARFDNNNGQDQVHRPRMGSKDSLRSTPSSSASRSNQEYIIDEPEVNPVVNSKAPVHSVRSSSSMQFRTSMNQASILRDSLLVPHGRQTEMGNELMRMDQEYVRATSIRRSSSDGLSPLLQAARNGDIVVLNALIVQPGTDILRRDPVYGQTALHFAIRGGHLSIVQALLMPQIAGSIVNIPDNRRNTALHLAAAKSRRMTRILLDAGADENFHNMRNQTPLGVHILTTTKDDPSMAEILLHHGADPNAPLDKSTVLHVALDKKLLCIATELVRRGARLDLKDEHHKMVFDKVEPGLLRKLLSQVAHPPVWIPNEERAECMECAKKFSALGARRHHCRYCGRLLCSTCASCTIRTNQLPFSTTIAPKSKKKEQRICKLCHDVYANS